MTFVHKKKDKVLGIFCTLFNGEPYVNGYLENVREQSIFESTRFYVLDCASEDKGGEIAQKFAEKHPNVFYKRLEKDCGLYAGWNICTNWSQEEYIGNWNIDDRKTPWSLEVLLNGILKDDSLDLVYGKTIVTTKPNDKWDTSLGNRVYPCLEHSFPNLLLNNSPHCMPIWKRSLHQRFGGFNEHYMTASDTDMWLKSCKGGANMKMINEIVGLYYENPTGRSTNPETLEKMIKEVRYVRSLYER